MTAHREVALHIGIVTYLRTVLPHGWRAHHSPNGAVLASGAREWSKLKAMGCIAGWPDIQICGPGGKSYFLEVKAPAIRGPGKKPGTTRILKEAGRISDEQTAVMDALQDLGFPVAVVDGIDRTREVCRKWGLPLREVQYEPMGATA